jgi:hypothetical protein
LTIAAARTALDAVLPNGTTVYLALFTWPPNSAGEGAVEWEGGGYARETIAQWLTVEVGAHPIGVRKVNRDAITFAANGLATDRTVRAIGVYDAATEGTLLAWAPTRTYGTHEDIEATEVSYLIPPGDEPQIPAEQMRIGIRMDEDEVITPIATTEQTVQTTNATPTILRQAVALVDGYAYHVELFVWGRTSNDKHYRRRVWASYYRDTTTSTWAVDWQDVDGGDTRVGFTTATAELQQTGNVVNVLVTGEAATTIDWSCDVKVRREVS